MTEPVGDAAHKDAPPVDVDKLYKEGSVRLTQALIAAISASRQTADLPTTGGQQQWGSVLFARLCGFGGSLMRLMPGSPASPTSKVWDFPSVAALTRCIFECYLIFFYLCADRVSEAEWLLRLNVMQLHDCVERHRILGRFGKEDKDLLDRQVSNLRGRVTGNKAFADLSSPQQARAVSGRSHMYLTQDEVMERFKPPMDREGTRGLYEFLSSAAHTFPFGFYRTMEHEGRGTGRENLVEKSYVASCADFAAQLLEQAEKEMQVVFDNLPKFERMRIKWDTLECNPISGHRAPMA